LVAVNNPAFNKNDEFPTASANVLISSNSASVGANPK
jgi:hypothetical protein